MDIHGSLQGYMEKMLREVEGMKVLLMDHDTVSLKDAGDNVFVGRDH